MVDIRSHVDIAAAPDAVFGYIADFSHNPEWQAGMKEARWTSEPPLRVGSTYDQIASFMGKTIESHFEVTALEPGRSISIETRGGTFPIQVTRAVEPTEDGAACRVTAHVRGGPTGVMRLMGPLMRWMVKRSVDKDYKTLKARLESEA